MTLTNYVVGTTAHPGGTWTIESTNTAQVGRYHDLAGLLEGSSTSTFTTSRPGCFPGPADNGTEIPSCFAQAAAGGLSVSMRAGGAVIERGTLVGPYIVVSESVATVTLATADATNPRIDRVDLQVLDGILGDNGGVSQTAFVVTTGTAAGSPVAPAAPANSIPITQIHLPANTTTITAGMIFDVRKSAGVRGGIRVLLPGDLLTDVGFGSGEWRDTSAVPGAVDRIDRWRQDTQVWEMVVDRTGATTQFVAFTAAQTVTAITLTTYADVVTGTTKMGTAFLAPASGEVRIGFGCNAFSGVNGSSLLAAPAVSTGGTVGSGTAVVAASDDSSLTFSQLVDVPGYRTLLVTGLTPGSTYNTWLRAHNSGSTSSHIDKPLVEVMPLAR